MQDRRRDADSDIWLDLSSQGDFAALRRSNEVGDLQSDLARRSWLHEHGGCDLCLGLPALRLPSRNSENFLFEFSVL